MGADPDCESILYLYPSSFTPASAGATPPSTLATYHALEALMQESAEGRRLRDRIGSTPRNSSKLRSLTRFCRCFAATRCGIGNRAVPTNFFYRAVGQP
jgi:hypothetical protein